MTTATEHWTEAPDDHDYPAAEDYLSLLVSPDAAHRLADELRSAAIEHRKAKDLLRASRLPVLGPDKTVRTGSRAAASKSITPPLDCVRYGVAVTPSAASRSATPRI